MKDPYSVLGVARGAADDEIKRAYRRLAKRYHPDLNPGKRAVEQQFRDIASAYELLSDPAKRQRFDRGEIDAEGRERGFGFPPGGGRRARAGAAADFSLDDVLDQILRRGRRGSARAERGQTATAAADGPALPVRLGFIEAALGGKRAVTLGDGRPVEVAIPAGIESGQKLRLRDAKAGDVFLEITVDPHPLFTRTGRDIQVETAMPLATAVLGGSITIPTIHGDVTVKVPKGSNGGATLRLKGKGIQGPGTAGDQYVKLKLVLPDPPDAELAVLLERWAQRARSPAR